MTVYRWLTRKTPVENWLLITAWIVIALQIVQAILAGVTDSLIIGAAIGISLGIITRHTHA